jgi:hypothetical protein
MKITNIKTSNTDVVRNSHTLAIAPNACQSKDNVIQTTLSGNKTLEQMLIQAGVDVTSVELTGQPTWIDLKNPIDVPTLQGNKTVSRVWYNGSKPVIEVVFEDGKTYKFTANHKLLVKHNNGDQSWVCVEDLLGDETIISVYDKP